MGDSKDKLFSSLSRLESNSAETGDSAVLINSDEHRLFVLFCILASLVGIVSLVMLLFFKNQLNVIVFSTLFMMMVLFLPAIALCGMLKVLIPGESVTKHIISVSMLVSMIIFIVLIQVLTINADVLKSYSVSEIPSQDQVVATFYEVGLSMIAGIVLLVVRNVKKWHLALTSFFVFWIVAGLVVNVAVFFRWFI